MRGLNNVQLMFSPPLNGHRGTYVIDDFSKDDVLSPLPLKPRGTNARRLYQ